MNEKRSYIEPVKLEKITKISDTPSANIPTLPEEKYPGYRERLDGELNKVKEPKKMKGIFDIVRRLWELLWSKIVALGLGKAIGYFAGVLRQWIYPYDVYERNENGEWVVDDEAMKTRKKAPKSAKVASVTARLLSILTFVLAYFRDPIKESTGVDLYELLVGLLVG
jgi:hypothetical protein